MSASNALAGVWLADPKLTAEEARDMLIEAMKIIQQRGLEAWRMTKLMSRRDDFPKV